MRALVALLALLTLVPAAASLPLAAVPAPAPPLALPPQGPDVPFALPPVATVVAFDHNSFSYEEGPHVATITVPSAAWNRVNLVFTGTPRGDPWDRLFSVGIAGFEVLRGTTPRTEFTVEREVTEYAALLPPGGQVPISVFLSTYVAVQQASVTLEFYDDPLGLVLAPHDAAIPAWHYRFQGGHGSAQRQVVDFGPTAPTAAIADIYLTGHGSEEFWFLGGYITAPQTKPRYFHLLVDGREVATVAALPYTYAFLGFAGADGTMGPQQQLIHTAAWWTAQQGLDLAGVHLGVGEIPAYRAVLRAEHLALLQGARTVELVQENGGGFWVSGVGFTLDY